MDLTIITVTYQSVEYIDSCILSVYAHLVHSTYEHLVVDNGSTDGTAELIEQGYSRYVRLIKNSSNLGFAKANQQAVKEAKGRYFLFLNPDMQIEHGSLDDLISWMDKRLQVGIASCKLLDALKHSHFALRPFKFPTLSPYLFSFLKLSSFFCTVHPKFLYGAFDDNLEQEVEAVRGAFMLMRRCIVESLGFAFDTRYFILFEDVDICREVKQLGYKVVYTPLISCIDYFGRSFLKQPRPWKYLHVGKSLKTYVRKWHNPLHLFWLNLIIPLGFMLRIPEWGFKNAWNALRLYTNNPAFRDS